MSTPRKLLIVIPSLLFILACQTVMRPVEQAQNAGSTAAAVVTQISGLATEAGDFTTQVSPISTLMAVPSGMPDIPGNIFDPQSPPLSEWNGIPVMPQALAGEEAQGMYAYSIKVTIKEVEEFYADKLPALGWSQQFSMPESQGISLLVYNKGDQAVSITITSLEDHLLVLINLQ